MDATPLSSSLNVAVERASSAIVRERQEKWKFLMVVAASGLVAAGYWWLRRHRERVEKEEAAQGKLTSKDANLLVESLAADTNLDAVNAVITSLPRVQSLNEQGNEAFRAGHYKKAVDLYTTALQQRESTRGLDCAVILANRAAAYLAQKLWQYAYVDGVGSMENSAGLWTKALWRTAISLFEMRDYDNSLTLAQRGVQFSTGPVRQRFEDFVTTIQQAAAKHKAETPAGEENRNMYLCDPPPVPNPSPASASAAVQAVLKGAPVELRETEARGRGVYVTRRVMEGTLLWQESPIVSVSLNRNTCTHCTKALNASNVVVCSESNTRYCSEDCRQRAWNSYMRILAPHTAKVEALLKEVDKEDGGMSVKIPLLAARVAASAMQNENWPTDPNSAVGLTHLWPRYHRLPPYGSLQYSFAQVLGLYGRMQQVLQITSDSSFLDIHWFDRFISILAGNAFGIPPPGESDPDYHMMGPGLALYAVAPLLPHSCKPNAELSVETVRGGLVLSVRATRRLLKNEQITVAYINPLIPLGDRTNLLNSLGVQCKCPRCAEESRSPSPPPRTSSPRSPPVMVEDVTSDDGVDVDGTVLVNRSSSSGSQKNEKSSNKKGRKHR